MTWSPDQSPSKRNPRSTAIETALQHPDPGSIRRECVDHFVVLSEAHLRRILRTYASYCNDIRTHRSLDKDAPVSRPAQSTEASNRIPPLADFITITSGFKFSVHTGAPRRVAGTLRLSLIELALNQVTRIEKRFIRHSRCRNG
jgi:hypothetical protein